MSSIKKVALITGAGSGIGKSSAIALAKSGYTVALTGRRIETLKGVADEIIENGWQATCHTANVGNADSVNALFKQVEAEHGRLDLLFNNAGIGAPSVNIEDITADQWQAVVDTNLTGSFLCAQQAIRIMKAQSPQGGRIINNGSISAHVPRPNSAPYTATKHAITGLTKSISLDCRQYNIGCGQIDIGNALTELAAKMATGMPQANGEIATEPLIDVQHIANTIVYMASLPLDANIPFITIMANQMPYIGRG